MNIISSLMYQNDVLEYYMGIAAVIALLAGVCLHSGILDRVVVQCEKIPPQKLVIGYKISYTKQLANTHFSEAMSILPTYRKIRIIYDKNLRKEHAAPLMVYATGFILNDNNTHSNDEVVLFMHDLGYKIHAFPEMTYVIIATHPYRNFFSINITRSRVYSKLASYISKRSLCAHPKFEIYEESNIKFMAPLHRQDDFYVDEAVIIPSYITGENNPVLNLTELRIQ